MFLFRIINYFHLRYHKALCTFTPKRSLCVLMNLWRLHKDRPFAMPQLAKGNYKALISDKLVNKIPQKEHYHFESKYANKITDKGKKLIKRPMHLERKMIFSAIVWFIATFLLVVASDQTDQVSGNAVTYSFMSYPLYHVLFILFLGVIFICESIHIYLLTGKYIRSFRAQAKVLARLK